MGSMHCVLVAFICCVISQLFWVWWGFIRYICQVNDLRTVLGPLSGRALQYANDGCLRRYLRARNWNVKKAEKMLRDSLAWRADYKPEELRWVSAPHCHFCDLFIGAADFTVNVALSVATFMAHITGTRTAEGTTHPPWNVHFTCGIMRDAVVFEFE